MAERSPTWRRSQRVLSMVGELHKKGYQRLRVVPAMSPSGMHWRCMITPASNTLRTHGAYLADPDWNHDLIATYTSGSENKYFGWEDCATATARQLADTFVERFPKITNAGMGWDWLYAGWYVEMLGAAESGYFPVVYDEDPEMDESSGMKLICVEEPGVRLGPSPILPLPPPGESDPVVENTE